MKNIHYRTQSLPESVYTHQMLHLTQHQDYHHAPHGHIHPHHQLASHQAAMIKKRNALRRSQTSVCDLLQTHHRAPLTAGLYEQFLPPPNFNAIGLPVHQRVNRASRTQSFYVPQSSGHYNSAAAMSRLASHHDQLQQHQQQTSPYYCDPSWYHRSVPNLPSTSYPLQQQSHHHQQQQQPVTKSVTTPLFVDCSVEYDLGDQPVIPKDSEPLLSIHPDYIKKCRSLPASPYDRKKPLGEGHKSLEDTCLASKRMMMDVRPSCRVARSTRSSPRQAAAARNNNSSQEQLRKLSCESRDSGIGLMSMDTPSWPGYTNSFCDTAAAAAVQQQQQASYQAVQAAGQSDYQGKMLPSKRFGLAGMNNFPASSSSARSDVATNHYQNLRIYYQLAF